MGLLGIVCQTPAAAQVSVALVPHPSPIPLLNPETWGGLCPLPPSVPRSGPTPPKEHLSLFTAYS